MKIDIIRLPKSIQSNRDTFDIGLAHILDGFIAILSLGRLNGSFSCDKISEVISKNIKMRRKSRKLNT